ncbi:MAG TPA: hypothetical protein VLA24_14520 [Pseudomonadales bacterium]|nr:hypothetical protein [Pseudomonadales bacterium]
MRLPDNIEKSAFRPKSYVGFGRGEVWSITAQRDKHGKPYRWDAFGKTTSLNYESAETLNKLSKRIQ